VKRIRLAWRGAWVTFVALPATLAALFLYALQSSHAPTVLWWLRSLWLGDTKPVTNPPPIWWLKALLLAAISSAMSAYFALGILLNFAYPLRPDATSTDWGGPTLLGRWGVHAAGGLLFLVLAMWLLPALQSLARRWLAVTQHTS
jgi:hypothetical protein